MVRVCLIFKKSGQLFSIRPRITATFDDVVRFLRGSGWEFAPKGSHRIFVVEASRFFLNLQPEKRRKGKGL